MKNVHEIEIKLEGEKWTKCLDNSFKKANKEVEIDGFRKGNAPKDVYLKKYGIDLTDLAKQGKIEQPVIPEYCTHNAHMYYIKVKDLVLRSKLIKFLNDKGIQGVFHYVPLHTSPAGKKFSEFRGEDKFTTKESERLLRLPLYYNIGREKLEVVVDGIKEFFAQ